MIVEVTVLWIVSLGVSCFVLGWVVSEFVRDRHRR